MPGARPFTVMPGGPLRGALTAPGDKSITHRALLLAALTVGESRIAGALDCADTRALARALERLGAVADWPEGGDARLRGFGVGGALQPDGPLDLGNSGTGARLLAGVLATSAVDSALVGDASLSRRPMARVADPLRATGADIRLTDDGTLPMLIRGAPLTSAGSPAPFRHRLAVPSAQVKSALLLAALAAPGVSRVIEPLPTRDHTERMLAAAGANVSVDGGEIAVRGDVELRPTDWTVPGDPSSAVFAIVAGLVVPGSEVRVENVLLSPTRAAFLDVLRAMGANLAVETTGEWLRDSVGTVTARAGPLRGRDVEGTPALIDEWPALFVAAAFARGTTVARGLSELRAKESDRLAAMSAGLSALGVSVEPLDEGLVIHGSAGAPLRGGATLRTHGDHRVAMALAVAGLGCDAPVTLDDMTPIATSYPAFHDDMSALGAW